MDLIQNQLETDLNAEEKSATSNPSVG